MRKNALLLAIFVAAVGTFLLVSPSHAQATRTWVSGVGDDANPCSRTAPCKTFAGAISKTATGGEINVLDPGGFGAVTITKSITISSEGFEAGVLVSGTNGIVISATTTSAVVLRGLDIEGLGTGLVGIKVLGGLGSLHVEKCTINNFRGSNGSGIEIAPTTAGTTQVFIKDTIIRNNGQGSGGGLLIDPGTGVTVKGALDNVQLLNNSFGARVQSTANVTVKNSIAAGNANACFSVVQVSSAPVALMLDTSVASNCGTFGLVANGTTNTTIARITRSTFTNNATGMQAQGSSQIISAGDNFNNGNTSDGAPTSTPGHQ